MSEHPFTNDKQFFSSIPVDKRSEYIIKMLATPHPDGEAFMPNVNYPYENTFSYKTYTLNYYHTELHPQPDAILFYLHGLNSNGNNSAYFGVNISNTIRNVNVYALDFLNFGKSDGGYKGYMWSIDELVSQAQAFVDHIAQKFSKKPKKFLLGGSFGGAISFKLTLKRPKEFDGVVFLVPALREVKQSQYYMKKLGKVVGYLLPKIKLTQQGHDDCKYHRSIQNPLDYNGRNIPGTIRVVLNTMEEIQTQYNLFDTPYIVFQAGVDKLVDPFAPLDLEKACKTKDKTTIYMKDMWHSIYNEKQIEQVVNIALDWLSARI